MSVPHWFRNFLLAILLPVSLALLIAALVIGTEAGRVWLAETGLSIAAGRFQATAMAGSKVAGNQPLASG